MTTPYKILNIREIPFNLNRQISVAEDAKQHLGVSFMYVLQYRSEGNVIALHAVARYMYDGTPLLEGGATFVVDMEGWQGMSHNEEDVRANPCVKSLIGYAHAFISGQHYRYSAATSLNSVFLPCVPADELASTLKTEQI